MRNILLPLTIVSIVLLSPSAWALNGDLDCSGNVDFNDITPFVIAIGNEAGYSALYPTCAWLNGDTDCDGSVAFGDINPFVDCIGNPSACLCPLSVDYLLSKQIGTSGGGEPIWEYFDPATESVAAGQPLRFEALFTPTMTPLFWDFGDGGIGTGIAPQHIFAAAGSYTIWLHGYSQTYSLYTFENKTLEVLNR